MLTVILRGAVVPLLVAALAILPGQAATRAAPPFSLPLFDGKALTLDNLTGQAVILLFWAPW